MIIDFLKICTGFFFGSLKHKNITALKICFSVLQFLELCRIATSITQQGFPIVLYEFGLDTNLQKSSVNSNLHGFWLFTDVCH